MNDELVLQAYFSQPETAKTWLKSVSFLSNTIRPASYGNTEEPRKRQHRLDDPSSFSVNVDNHVASCWAYGRGFKYTISIFDNLYSEATAWSAVSQPEFWSNCDKLIESWDAAGAAYAYGATLQERRARNGYMVNVTTGGRSEGWFGRRVDRYVPGLYWINYFSTDYAHQKGVDVELIARALNGSYKVLSQGTMLRLYERPDQWPQHNEAVQRFIDRTKSFFSRNVISIPTLSTLREEFDWSGRIAQEWP